MDWIDIVFNGSVAALRYCASVLGMSYQELNVWFFCVAWPLVTVLMMVAVVMLWRDNQVLRNQILHSDT